MFWNSKINPDFTLEVRDERGKEQKNQRLIFKIRSSATDAEDKAIKLLICSNLPSEYLPVGRQGISNADAAINSNQH